jgi:DNA-directed RNA polymerase subunit beta'
MEEIIDSPEQQDQSIIIMNKSGARGNISQFTQLIGMRGLMAKSYNYTLNEGQVIRDTIEIPVKTSFLEGLSVSEYFNASYSARKAMADTALKTSKSGYMTRKLVDSSQDVVIVSDDCGTTKPLVVSAILNKEGQIIESLAERIEGRYTISAIKSGNKIIVPADTMISKEQAIAIEKEGIQTVEIRSPIHCNCKNGVCKKCYGKDISTNSLVEMGATVGVVAGQSLGEPVTQINMNTKHTGGVSGGTQIAQGYERLKQLLDVINPKEFEKAAIAPLAGKVISITKNDEEISILIKNSIDEAIVSVNRKSILIVKPDDIVELGQKLTQGSINMKQLLEIRDIEAVRHYIINEVQRVYRAQGIEVNDKYIEIIVAQMTNKLIILNQGDSDLSIGQTINASELVKINSKLLSEGKTPLLARNEIFGLDDIPSKSNSFLSAASFQDTKKILVDSAIKGQIDDLTSLNANVMLGNLIPAGTAIKDVEEIIADGQETFREEY